MEPRQPLPDRGRWISIDSQKNWSWIMLHDRAWGSGSNRYAVWLPAWCTHATSLGCMHSARPPTDPRLEPYRARSMMSKLMGPSRVTVLRVQRRVLAGEGSSDSNKYRAPSPVPLYPFTPLGKRRRKKKFGTSALCSICPRHHPPSCRPSPSPPPLSGSKETSPLFSSSFRHHRTASLQHCP